jgi:hypothetical protein
LFSIDESQQQMEETTCPGMHWKSWLFSRYLFLYWTPHTWHRRASKRDGYLHIPILYYITHTRIHIYMHTLLVCKPYYYYYYYYYAMHTNGKVLRVKNISLFQMCLTILK